MSYCPSFTQIWVIFFLQQLVKSVSSHFGGALPICIHEVQAFIILYLIRINVFPSLGIYLLAGSKFFLNCPRRIFLKWGEEVPDHGTTGGAQPRSWAHSITQSPSWSQPLPTFLEIAPPILLPICIPKSYILNTSEIFSIPHSLPFGPSISLPKNIPLYEMPSMSHTLYRAFARSFPPLF